MDRDQLFELHKKTTKECFETLQKKNHDYSGASEDPFANFNNSEIFGVPGEIGILMRMLDKMKRIQAFVQSGKLEVDESVEDAWDDIVNYAILGKGLTMSNRECCGDWNESGECDDLCKKEEK